MPQRSASAALAACLALTLAACHSVKALVPPNLRAPTDTGNALKLAKQQLQQATPCCSSFADFSYARLLPSRPRKFDLGPGSMVANLNGVRSYFLAFRLPRDAKPPYRVALKAELNGRWLQNSYLFGPTVVVLDEAFQPLHTDDVALCEHMGWTSTTSGAFGSIVVNDPKARYLVVYSSAAQQSGNTYWEQSPAAFSAESPVQMTVAGSFKIPHGPDGSVWVGMMDKAFRSAVDRAVCGKPPEGNGLLNTLLVLPGRWLGSDTDSGDAGGNGTGGNSSAGNKDN